MIHTLPNRDERPAPAALRLWRSAWSTSWFLTLSIALYALAFVLALSFSFVDGRLVTGTPTWIKPMKFALSLGIYSVTLAWMLTFVPRKGWRRWLAFAVAVLGSLMLIGELALIGIQATRGVASHFNNATPFDDAVFSAMGSMITLFWFINLGVAALLATVRLEDRALLWGMRLGVGVALVGMALGFVMVVPTAAQAAQLEQGLLPTVIGAHNVGVPDGGAGLPFVGWSLVGGDLRIAHFVGIHAMQVLPLLALMLGRLWGNALDQRRRIALVATAAVGYLALTLLTLWQALRGQPIVAPDATTLAAFAAILLGVVVATLAIVRGRVRVASPRA